MQWVFLFVKSSDVKFHYSSMGKGLVRYLLLGFNSSLDIWSISIYRELDKIIDNQFAWNWLWDGCYPSQLLS